MGSRNQSLEEAVIAILGKDGITQLLDKVQRKQDEVVESQKRSTKAAEEQAAATRGLAARWEALTDRLSAFQTAVGIVAAGQIVEWAGRVGSALGEAATTAARAEAVGADFARRFGDATAAMERLREATRGTVADAQLQALATQGARAGLTLEQLAQLMEASTRAAVGSGRDVSETAQEILKSTVEANDEALKQLGIVVNLDAAFAAYAARIGSTTDALSAQQRTAAALDQTVGAVRGQFEAVTGAETSANLQRVGAWWENLKQGAAGAAVAAADFGGALAAIPEQLRNSESVTEADRIAARLSTLADQRRQAAADAAALWRGESLAIIDTRTELAKWLDGLGAAAQAEVDRAAQAERAATAQRALDAARQRNLDLSREGVMALGRELEAEEAARLAAINHAGALAQMATQLGYSQQAADRWAEALAAADKAGWDLTQRVDLLTDAARASNDEFARTLEIQAQLAAEAGDASTAAALRAQLIGRLASREDGRSAPLATSRSGGAPRTDPMVAQRAEWARADKAFWDRYFAETSRQQADVDAARERAADADRQARIDAIYQQVDDLKAAQDAERQAAAERLSESLGSARSAADMLADSMVRLNGIDLSGLSVAVDQLQPLIDNIELLGSAQGKTREGMQKGAAGIIAASGRATAALIKDQTAQAAVMAVMETAASIAAFAFSDYRAGALHAVAAATYGIVAGMSAAGAGRGASGGGGASASRRDPGRSFGGMPSQTAQQPTPAPITYNTYVTAGALLGPDEQSSARSLGRLLDAEQRRRAGPGYGFAPA